MEQSYIGKIGKAIEPVIRPCGLKWKEGVSIITGVGAKEIVASTMGVLYSNDKEEINGNRHNNKNDVKNETKADNAKLSQIIANSDMTPLSAFAFMIFVLLYMPCIPACIAIKHESGKWKWAFFAATYTTCLAWICSTLIYQIGNFFT